MCVLVMVALASVVQQAEDARAAKNFALCATLFARAATEAGIERGQ